MKNAARRLSTITGVVSPFVLAFGMAGGCAAGSAESPDDAGVDTATSNDASADSPSTLEAAARADVASPRDTGSGDDAEAGDTQDASDSGNAQDAQGASDASDGEAGSDAGPGVIFGTACPAGTTYTEPFTSDPVADGTFLPLIGSYSYSAANKTFSLTANSANTQLWIGPRPAWTTYTISVPVRIDSTSSNGNGGINFFMQSTPASPANDSGQMYYAGISPTQVMLGIENGSWTEFAGPSATMTTGTFHTLQVTAKPASFSVSVDGTAYITNFNNGTYTFGSIGLRTFASGMTYGPIQVTCN